jgi:hypothetical protein
LVLFPGTFNAGSTAQSATADYLIKFQLIDVDYQVVSCCSDRGWWGYMVGARAARLVQDFDATFPFAPPDGTTTLNTSATFQGVGPSLGLEGERIICAGRGFRAYGKTSASFLVGSFHSSYFQNNQFNGVEVNTAMRDPRIVPVLDLELGLAWTGPGERLRISGGYLISAWFNSVTTPAWINSVQDLSFQPGSNTLTFDGLVARAELRF